MSEPIVVNQSTSVVQVDTSTVVYPNSAVVLLSSITAAGTIITIRDITGYASTNRGIAVSTTSGVHYLDGPGCNVYNINQPYGFLTVTPRTSNVWAVINTFAFPDQAAHPNVEGIDARRGNFSNLSGNTGSFNNLTVFYSTFMNVATVSSVLARSISTQSLAVASTLSVVSLSTISAKFSSVTINNPLTPSTSLEVNGSMRASTIFLTNSAYVRGSLVYNTNNIVSTVQGLGTATYVSTASLVSTVQGLGTATYVSTASLVSTVQGLGTASYVSTASLVSTVRGLGTSTYISSSSLVSTIQGLGSAGYLSSPVTGLISSIIGLGDSGFVSTTTMISTVQGLGSSRYVSSTGLVSTIQGLGSSQYVSVATMASTVIGLGSSQYVSVATMASTVVGLGSSQYVSTASLVSTIQGLGTAGYISSASFVSTVQGLGTTSYVSTASLVSTVQGLGTASYVSTASLVSTVQGLGTATYVSTASLVSTVRGLGTAGYISSPHVVISSMSTHSLTVYGPSTFIDASNIFIGASISTNTLRFIGTYKDGFGEPTQYTNTVIAERIYDEGLLTEESSELLLFKGNDGNIPVTFGPGPDRVRVLAAGGFRVDIASNGGIWPVGGQPPSTAIQAFTINCNGFVGIGCNIPSYTLDVAGTINACNIGINGSLLVTTSNLVSTVRGAGTSGYVSSASLVSTVQGLGTSSYISSTGLVSTVQGLGTAGYVSSVANELVSTVKGLGSSQYVSSTGLVSTVQGLGSSLYVSSTGLVSTVQGLGTSTYISSSSLASTVQGLGTSGYISSPHVVISSLSTHSLTVYGPSTIINASNIFIGASVSTNVLRFLGTAGDSAQLYTNTVIGERIYDGPVGTSGESSELLLFKGNDAVAPFGPDRVRVLSPGGFQVDISTESSWPIGGQPPPTTIQAFYIGCNGRVGIGCNSPSFTLDVNGSINASGTINARGFVNSDNLASTVQGLGTAAYISSSGLASTVQGLGTSSYISSSGLASTVQGLGTSSYISSTGLVSTVKGLGTASYLSTPSLVSTVQGLGTASYLSTPSLVSTVQGLGTASYLSTASLVSTVQGLGTASYLSTPSLVSTVEGLGTSSYISSASLVSTVEGLGTSSYISTASLVSTVQGLGTASYVSTASLVSTVIGLGTATYVSTASLVSTVQGLGSSGYISSPHVLISSLSTHSLTVYGPSTFVNASNLFIGASVSTNVLRFLGTAGDSDQPYTHTVIGERIYDGLVGSAGQSSELLLFKGNDAAAPFGPDRVRVLSPGGFQVDISTESSWPIGGQPPSTTIQAFYIGCNGRIGINCNSPSFTLDINGSINASGSINARGFVNSDNLASTVQGLGTAAYISSSGLASTVQGLGNSSYISSSGLVSTVQGLGTAGYVSSFGTAIVSTVQGLGTAGYLSSLGAVLVSTVQGLGTAGYMSSPTVTGFVSTVQGLGSSRYISSPIVSLSTLSTQSLIAFGESTFLFSSNVYIGNSLSTNILRFYGTSAFNSFGVNQYARTVIAERSFSNDTSELLLFKANNPQGILGPDNVRVLAAGGFQVDIASNGGVWPINGNPPSTVIQAFTVNSNGYVGINCNSPRSTLDINGIVNVSSNIYVNGLPVVTFGNGLSSNYVATSNFLIGASPSTNTLRFLGTNFDSFNEGDARRFTHSVIGERIYAPEELSELLIFKGDNSGCNSWGPDRVRVLASGGFVVDIAQEGCNWPLNMEPPAAVISNALSIGRDGVIRTASTILVNGSPVITSGGAGGNIVLSSNVGINCNTPVYTLDVGGIINASSNIIAGGTISATCNMYVNGNPVVTSRGVGGSIGLTCNVGINCNTPAYTLDVAGIINASSNIIAGGTISASCNIFVNGNRVVTSGGAGGTTVLSCNVGINCNTPAYTLDVAGIINASCNMYVNGNPVVTSGGGGGGSTSFASNVGINCNTPVYTLDVAGIINASSNIIAGGTISASCNMYVNGRVGIGCNSPANALDVVGSIRASPYIIGGSIISSNGPSTRSEMVLWAGTNGYFDWVTTNNQSGVAGCGLQLLWYGAENIAVPNTLYSVNFCNATTTIPGTLAVGDLHVGGSSTSNMIRFRGISGDGPGAYSHSVIGERIYASPEASELLIFKGNGDGIISTDADRDRVRVLSSGGFQVDIAHYLPGAEWLVGGNPPATKIQALNIDANGNATFFGVVDAGAIVARVVNNNSVRLTDAGADRIPAIIFSSNFPTYQAAIGYNATTNNMIFGFGNNPTAGFLGVVTAPDFVATSDKTLKENIVDARTNYLDDLNKLRVVNYNRIGKTKKELGFIAQEVEEVFPSVVEINKHDNTKGYSITALTPMLVSAVQSLSKTVSSLQGQIDEIKSASNPIIP